MRSSVLRCCFRLGVLSLLRDIASGLSYDDGPLIRTVTGRHSGGRCVSCNLVIEQCVENPEGD
jgi:hypothetical protein